MCENLRNSWQRNLSSILWYFVLIPRVKLQASRKIRHALSLKLKLKPSFFLFKQAKIIFSVHFSTSTNQLHTSYSLCTPSFIKGRRRRKGEALPKARQWGDMRLMEWIETGGKTVFQKVWVAIWLQVITFKVHLVATFTYSSDNVLVITKHLLSCKHVKFILVSLHFLKKK